MRKVFFQEKYGRTTSIDSKIAAIVFHTKHTIHIKKKRREKERELLRKCMREEKINVLEAKEKE